VSEFSPVLHFQAMVKLSTNTYNLANYMLASTGPKTGFMKMVEIMVVKEMKKLYRRFHTRLPYE